MPNSIIVDNKIVDDSWQLLEKDADTIPAGAVIMPQALWNQNRESAEVTGRDEIGVWLDCDEPPHLIAQDLGKFAVVAINFSVFTDGRGFTYARELRDTHNYKGEIRAIGGFMRDQLFYLKRCGFNAFALENSDQKEALASLDDFSISYQADTDQAKPLFNHR